MNPATPSTVPVRSWGKHLFLAIGLVAGVGSGFVASQWHDFFGLPEELLQQFEQHRGANPPPELSAHMRAAGIRAEFYNGALVVGISGALLCTLLGGVAGWSGKQTVGLFLGGLLGAVLGGAAGAGGGLLSKFVDNRIPIAEMDEFYRATLMQVSAWMPVGLAAGLAVGTFGKGWRSFAGIVLTSCCAAGIGAGVYPFLSMIVLPTNRLSRPLPEEFSAGVLWAGLACILVGLATGRLFTRRAAGKQQATPVPSEDVAVTS